jgi:hypothetical protein
MACPQCGAPVKPSTASASFVADAHEHRRVSIPLIFGIFLMPYIFWWFLLRQGYSKQSRIIGFGWMIFLLLVAGLSQANPSGLPTAEHKAPDEAASKRNTNIVMYARSLKAAARNPDSIVYDEVLANGDGTLVCFNYRAQNGFGGMNRETVAFSTAGGAQDRKIVRTICRDKIMKDVTEEAVQLIRLMG